MKLLDWLKMNEAKGDSPAKIIATARMYMEARAPQESRLKISDLTSDEARTALLNAEGRRDMVAFKQWYKGQRNEPAYSFAGYSAGAADGWLACLAAIRSGEVKP